MARLELARCGPGEEGEAMAQKLALYLLEKNNLALVEVCWFSRYWHYSAIEEAAGFVGGAENVFVSRHA